MLSIGDIVTNGHVHDDKGTKMRAKIIAMHDGDAWVIALTGPHEGHKLTLDTQYLTKVTNNA